jgi:hypothetical protein
MKKIIAIHLLALCIIQCGQFPNRFERIEEDAQRFISFAFQDHAEGAPGDTMRLRGFFAGEKTTDVEWLVSYDCVISQYGDETVLNIRDLPLVDITDRLPDSIDISFIIPDSVFFTTEAITPQMVELIRQGLPASMNGMSRQDMAAFLYDLGAVDWSDLSTFMPFIEKWGDVAGITGLDSTSLEQLVGVAGILVNAFSIRGKIFANATSEKGSMLKIRKNFTVRYNSRLRNTPFAEFAPVNRNPAVRWIGVYKVEDFNGMSFSPQDTAYEGKYTMTYLYNEQFPWKVNDTIVIEKGYAYFLGADSGTVTYSMHAGDSMMVDGRLVRFAKDTVFTDSVLDKRIVGVDSAGRLRYDDEIYYYNWQYQPWLDSVTEPLDSLFVIVGAGAGGGQPPIVRFLPSLDKKMSSAHLWVSVYDNIFGELNRPVGFTVRNLDMYFKYED